MSTTPRASTGSPSTRILSVGSAVPSRVLGNDDLCRFIDSSDEWITQRTGIKQRRWLADGESLESLAVEASRAAIARCGVAPARIDAVILATVSRFRQMPALAPRLADELGLDHPAAYDISAACAGFCYALAQADALIRAGHARHVLVVAADTLSPMTDVHDRSTAFLFADGAGAAIVGPCDVNGIGPVVWGSDGGQAGAIWMTSDWPQAVGAGRPPAIGMDGRAVFRWATTHIATAARRCLDEAGLAPGDLDVFLPHQANNRITDALVRALDLPKKVVVARTITKYGNTSSSSVPIAMDDLLRSGEAKSGQTALIIGFGAGLAYAGQVVTLP